MTDANENLSAPGEPCFIHGRRMLVRAPRDGAEGRRHLTIILNTLMRLPRAHVQKIPVIVFGDTVGGGSVSTGGNTRNRGRDIIYVQLTYSALQHSLIINGYSRALMHETGHVATHAFGIGNRVRESELRGITYTGNNRNSRFERFADAYRMYMVSPYDFARRLPNACRAVERELRRAGGREQGHTPLFFRRWLFPPED